MWNHTNKNAYNWLGIYIVKLWVLSLSRIINDYRIT